VLRVSGLWWKQEESEAGGVGGGGQSGEGGNGVVFTDLLDQ
jgi:hypothetical protein